MACATRWRHRSDWSKCYQIYSVRRGSTRGAYNRLIYDRIHRNESMSRSCSPYSMDRARRCSIATFVHDTEKAYHVRISPLSTKTRVFVRSHLHIQSLTVSLCCTWETYFGKVRDWTTARCMDVQLAKFQTCHGSRPALLEISTGFTR